MLHRAPLQIQTVYVADADRGDAHDLGVVLYETLTRRLDDRLAFGPGIPVRVAVPHEKVNLEEADHVVVVPVLGKEALQDEAARRQVLALPRVWSTAAKTGHVLPVLTSEGWRAHESKLGVKPLLTKLYKDGDGWDHTLLSLVVSVCRLLRAPGQALHVFVSHAKRDLGRENDEPEPATKRVAEKIRDFVKSETIGEAFFDTTDLRPGRDLEGQLKTAAGNGVFVAVRTDSYSSRAWCQKELLSAKRMGVPTLTVELLREGEHRSSPYGGNGPTIRWTNDPHRVVLRAMTEWLRATNFRLAASRLLAGLPQASVLTRPPELLDLAQGPLLEKGPTVVLHPDPEIARAEGEVLRATRPRLRLVTPTTLYRGVGSRRAIDQSGAAPEELPFAALRGRQIGMSLSNVLDDDGIARGLLRAHVDDCIVHVARSLISAGAAIAYGGDFRVDGFDELLAQLISTYNESEVDEADLLFSYIGACVDRSRIPDDLPVTVRALGWTEPFKSQAVLPPPDSTTSDGRRALHFSDMRRLMTQYCFARVAIGGQARPKRDGGAEGYGGAYPGVVEEVWWSVRAGKPAYVIGGFGGAAGAAAALLLGRTTPVMQAETWRDQPGFTAFTRICDEVRSDAFRPDVEAPATMAEMAEQLREIGRSLLADDNASRGWNGLTVAENQELFRSTDVVRITALVMKGLFEVLASESRGKLSIELVRGSITQVEGVDAIAIAAFGDVEIMGAGAALDSTLSGRVTAAARSGESIVELTGAEVDADWLVLGDLGERSKISLAELPAQIENATAVVGGLALRHGFRRLGVVTFGGTTLELEVALDRMLAGFTRVGGSHVAALQWLELDPARFARTRAFFEAREDVVLTTRELSVRAVEPKRTSSDIVAIVRWRAPALECTLLPPAGVAALGEHHIELPRERLVALAQTAARRAPEPAVLEVIGTELAELVFGDENIALLERHEQCRLVVQHDVASSAIPFETLRIGGARLSVKRRVVRRPSLEGLRLVNLGNRPPRSGPLRMLLVVNPTCDLPSTETEALAVKNALVEIPGIEIKRELWHGAATVGALVAALSDPDIDLLHYAGHGYFAGTGLGNSGIECADGTLGLAELSSIDLAPRVVFFNACQSAQMRQRVLPEVAQAFAEYFLRAGIEAYVGTFWPVGDDSAAQFASSVYRALARGEALDQAVRLARLEIENTDDWANYVLYGDGGLRLHVGDVHPER